MPLFAFRKEGQEVLVVLVGGTFSSCWGDVQFLLGGRLRDNQLFLRFLFGGTLSLLWEICLVKFRPSLGNIPLCSLQANFNIAFENEVIFCLPHGRPGTYNSMLGHFCQLGHLRVRPLSPNFHYFHNLVHITTSK